jgi:hypothetical protein
MSDRLSEIKFSMPLMVLAGEAYPVKSEVFSKPLPLIMHF